MPVAWCHWNDSKRLRNIFFTQNTNSFPNCRIYLMAWSTLTYFKENSSLSIKSLIELPSGYDKYVIAPNFPSVFLGTIPISLKEQ